METPDIQQQINELNRKVDILLEYVQEQRLKGDVVEDLIADVSIVTKDAFKSVVQELDDRGCDLDTQAIKQLLFNFLRNTKNISQALEMFESGFDFFRDAAPIAREMIIDFIHKLHEFEQKGYFEYLAELYRMLGEMQKHYSVDDLKDLSANMGSLFSILKLTSDAQFMKSLKKTTNAIATLQMDDKLDNKSLYKIYKELKSPEVRKAISYTLRVIKESGKS